MTVRALTVGLAVIKRKVLPVAGVGMTRLAVAGDIGVGGVVGFQRQMTIGTLTVGLTVVEGEIPPIRRLGMTRLTVTGDTGMGGVVGFQR